MQLHYLLFGALFAITSPQELETFGETKAVLGYYFETKQGKKFFETFEESKSIKLRVRKSFPKHAKEPFLEVISYERKGVMVSQTFTVESGGRGFKFKSLIDNKEVFFNF